ncbi:MAG: hypothetical protein COB02_16125 [Candidatus Cloacimonadota bacterium]|nr:MAG: hypothetical protein COB02_16125 [Candidatus Cloacimonadota bacterium]
MTYKFINSQVLPHFKKVLTGLNWDPNIEPEILIARGHIIFKFLFENKSYIYRLAKFSHQQIQRQIIASRLYKEFCPEIFYFDERCIIEEYISGDNFTHKTNYELWEQLGHILSTLHKLKCNGFGDLVSSNNSEFATFEDFIQDNLSNISLIHKEQFLSKEKIKKLENFISNPPPSADLNTKIMHGDIWPQNIIHSKKTNKPMLIDWENISSNYRESDFIVFSSYKHPDIHKIREIVFKSYKHPLNSDLINYFIVFKALSRYEPLQNSRELTNYLNKKILELVIFFDK